MDIPSALPGAVPAPRHANRRGVALLICFFIIAYLIPSGTRTLLRPDEFRYAEIPREMIASGDWFSPRLAGMRYFEKPALGYQLTAISFKIFGKNAFATRFPAMLSAGLTAAFLYFLLKKSVGGADDALPLLGTGIYLAFGLVWGIGTFAVLDSQLTLTLTVAIGAIFLACESRGRLAPVLWMLAAGAAAGAAFLLKGGLGLVIPALVAGVFLIWKREWKKLFLFPLIALIPAVAIILPWALAIHRAEPGFWHYFLVMEHWNRLTGSTYDRSPEPFWYFLPVLLGGMLPSGAAAAALKAGWRGDFFRSRFALYLLLWFALPFLLFSAASCKLGTYILPCFPPLAGLLAMFWRNAEKQAPETLKKIQRFLAMGYGILFAAAGITAVAAMLILPRIRKIAAYCDFGAMAWLTAAVLVTWGVLLYRWRGRDARQLGALFLTGMALTLCFGTAALPSQMLRGAAAGDRIEECLRLSPLRPGDIVLADKSMVVPVSWMLKRTDVIIVGRPGELEYALKEHSAEYAGRQYDEPAAETLLRSEPRGNKVMFLLRRRSKRLPANWPEPLVVVDTGSVTMLRF